MKKVFQFIHAERVNYPVTVLARTLQVNRTAYYSWAKRAPSARELEDRDLTRKIREIHAANRGLRHPKNPCGTQDRSRDQGLNQACCEADAGGPDLGFDAQTTRQDHDPGARGQGRR